MAYRTIAITDEDYQDLKRLAHEQGRTLSGEVRHLIREATNAADTVA